MYGVESIYFMDGYYVNLYCGCIMCVMGMDLIFCFGNLMYDVSVLYEVFDMYVFVFVLVVVVIFFMS